MIYTYPFLVQCIIVINESRAAKNICELDDSSHSTLYQIEAHIYSEDQDLHRATVLEDIDGLITQNYAKATAEFRNNIASYINRTNQQRRRQPQNQQLNQIVSVIIFLISALVSVSKNARLASA